jgi:cobalt-zinc-cadmium efflux system protein
MFCIQAADQFFFQNAPTPMNQEHAHDVSAGGLRGRVDVDSHREMRHRHAPADFGRALAIGVALNIGFVVVQVVFGIAAHSLALVSDAGHNFGDVLGLLLAWWASYLAKRPATERRTYGMRRSSILAALANAILLLMAVAVICWEAVRRFMDPAPVAGWTVILVAAAGVIVNLIAAMLFRSGSKGDLNIRGAFLHMIADAAVSGGVVIAGIVILFTGWQWLDPAASLIINLVIVWGTWGLLRDSVNLALDAVPSGTDPVQVDRYLQSLSGVTEVHHLHIWALSTTETALTVHLVKPERESDDLFLKEVRENLRERFAIDHATIQVETTNLDCPNTDD